MFIVSRIMRQIHKKGVMYVLTIHHPKLKIINILKTDQLMRLYKVLSL